LADQESANIVFLGVRRRAPNQSNGNRHRAPTLGSGRYAKRAYGNLSWRI